MKGDYRKIPEDLTLSQNFSFVSDASKIRAIFLIDSWKTLSCFPLKSGTTNWQSALIPLVYEGKEKIHEGPEFGFIPRFHHMFNAGTGLDYKSV